MVILPPFFILNLMANKVESVKIKFTGKKLSLNKKGRAYIKIENLKEVKNVKSRLRRND